MAINYNDDVLPLYDTKLETNPEYVQELASVSTRGFDDTDTTTIGVSGDNFLLNTVSVIVGGTATLDDWLAAIVAVAPVTSGDLEAAIVQQSNGDYVIVIIDADDGTPVDIVLAAGSLDDALPLLGLPAGTVVSGGDLQTGRADQKNEKRLLTTLGVLVSHLRLLGSRDESRNLHFILSRIATGVGSGGFVYRDQTASVTGNRNRKNLLFTAGDEINIGLVNEGEGVEDTPEVYLTGISATPFDLDELVTAINAASTAVYGDLDSLEASNDGGYLKLHSENGLTIEVVDYLEASTSTTSDGTTTSAVDGGAGSNNGAVNKVGLEYENTRSKRNEVAEKVKEEALDYFDTNRRKLNL